MNTTMANSPGPSTSQVIHPKDKQKEVSDETKKKRNRRRPRARKRPSNENHKTENANDDDEYAFTIKSVIQSGLAYRRRDETTGHIHIYSFVKDVRTPCVFKTPQIDGLLLHKLQDLNLNGVIVPKASSATSSQKKTEPKRKKKCLVFPEYYEEEEVLKGLEAKQLFKGNIRINAKNVKLAYVGNTDTCKLDYVICTIVDRNRALEGDEVVIRPKISSENPTEKNAVEVVFILKELHPRTAIGRLEPIPKSKEYALFIPRDRRIPKMKIPKISWPLNFATEYDSYKNTLFQAKISKWDEVKQAIGLITETLGQSGDLRAESLSILREFCLDTTPYGNNIQKFLPKSTKIPKKEFLYREDLRKSCIFTIDPATAKDLDDAVSCKRLPNGNLEVGVHISDASFYLHDDTKLDEIVREKATTIYMVDSVYHMLPIELCLQCSLLPACDKLAFSVVWEMTAEGEVLSKRITRSVINSCVQLSYEHAQMMIDDPVNFDGSKLPEIHNGFTANDLSQIVNDLQTIAVCLRRKRADNGSLKIDQIKIGFALNPANGEPKEFYVQHNIAAHRLIEEFMLLANMTVAECINSAFPDLAFLRLHEPPKPTMMADLKRNMEKVGVFIDIESSKSIQMSLDKYQAQNGDIHVFRAGLARMTVLNHLLAKPMKRARYFCAGCLEEDESFQHFALSIPIYTHFTSPIRRYADIVVHRLLAASLKYCERPALEAEQVADIADICNRQKYHAKRAGEASSDLYLAHYVEHHQPFVQDGVVVDVRERFLEVIVLTTGSTIRIYKEKIGDKLQCRVEQIEEGSDPDSDSNKRKNYRFIVTFPPTHTHNLTKTVLETFSLVKLKLTRKPNCNQLEAQLCR